MAWKPALDFLSNHRDELLEIKRKMEAYEIEATTVEPGSNFNAAKWLQGAMKLQSQLEKFVESKDVITKDKLKWIVDCVRSMLFKAATATSSSNLKTVTSEPIFKILRFMVMIFGRPELDVTCLSLLKKIQGAINHVHQSHERFCNVAKYSQELKDVKRQLIEKKTGNSQTTISASQEMPMSSVPSSACSVVARFETLVSSADELLAVSVSERSGRVSKYLVSVQKELRAVFPAKGKRTTPSRVVLGAAAEAVRKAVELIQYEFCGGKQGAFFNQFPELLYAIGSKYHTFKLQISRSRDELYQYLFPNATKPTSPFVKPKPAAAATTTPTSDESALREQLLVVFRRVQSWHDDVFSLKEFDEVMRVLRAVMSHSSVTWRVRRDRTVSECLRLLAVRALAIKKLEHRQGRLASVEQWQKQMEI